MKKITFLLLMAISYTTLAQQPTSAPPGPTEDAADVVSVFSDAFTSAATLAVAGFSENAAAIITAASNDVYEFQTTPGQFVGFDLNNSIDISAMENLHYDIWIGGTTAVGAVFNSTLSQHNGGHLTGQTNGYVDTNAIAEGQEGMWLSFDIPLNEMEFGGLTSMAPRDIISQLVFTFTNLSNGGSIFVDNIYFWREAVDTNADASLSDLQVDGNTVMGFSPTVLSYDIELANGTTMVPVVTGVATQNGSGSSNVSVTPASGIPGTTTVDVTAPNGTDMQTYTVNFTEATALPPAAPTPPSVPAISVLSDVFSNITVPQVDVFGGALTNLDLNTDGNEEARSLINGSGFQFNFFPNGAFVDISQAAFLHIDFYAEGLADNDVLRIRLLDPDPGANGANIARIDLQASDSGTWVSVDLELPSGSNLNDFGDVDSASSPVDLTQLSLIQFNTLDVGSSLGSKEIFLSNIYFFGGTLSTSDLTQDSFNVSPNPTKDSWAINGLNRTIESIEVFDILGKNVLSLIPNATEATIDASALRTGIYLARVTSQEGTQTLRLVKN